MSTDTPTPEKPWRDEELVRERYEDDGLSYSQIAERWDCCHTTVYKWADKFGIDHRDQHETFDTPRELVDADELYRLYHDEGLTADEIAERVGRAYVTVIRWMDKHGIERRDDCIERVENPADRRAYDRYWREVREEALERDDWKCRECGLTDDEHRETFERGLHVHHRVKAGRFEVVRDAHVLSNLLSLCDACHKKWEALPVQPPA